MTLKIEALRGVWRAQIDHRTYLANTLEELLLEITPHELEDGVWTTAEVLGAILGAEVVETPHPSFAESDPEGWEEMRQLIGELWGKK